MEFQYKDLKETSTFEAKVSLIVGNTILFQISVESPVMKYQFQAKQVCLLPIFAFKFPARRHLGLHDVIWLTNCFTQKMLCFLTVAATTWRPKIQNGGAREI